MARRDSHRHSLCLWGTHLSAAGSSDGRRSGGHPHALGATVHPIGRSTGLLWGVGAMFALGLALALLDRVTEASSPMVAVLIVRLLSIIPAYLFTRSRGEVIRLPQGWDGKRLLLGAALLDAGGYVTYNLGIDAAPVPVVAPIVAAHPVVTVALAVVLLRERPRSLQWAGAGVTVAAVIALSAVAA